MRSDNSLVAPSPRTRSPGKQVVAELVRRWKELAANVRELAALDQMMENMGQDLGLSSAELRALAAKGSNAAKELACLLKTLRIDFQVLAQNEPLVLRDLQRLCALCDHKRECNRDIAVGALAARYQNYCPNADTVRALKLEPKFNAAE